ncbi:MAG: hypothetical protein WBC71_06975, partial [Salaquimonas sp.]
DRCRKNSKVFVLRYKRLNKNCPTKYLAHRQYLPTRLYSSGPPHKVSILSLPMQVTILCAIGRSGFNQLKFSKKKTIEFGIVGSLPACLDRKIEQEKGEPGCRA